MAVGLVALMLSAAAASPLTHSPDTTLTAAEAPTATGKSAAAVEPTPAQHARVTTTSATPTTTLADTDDWSPIISEDFDTPAALGRFAQTYPGWASYDTYHDTYGTGLYDSGRVVTVGDGILNEHVHSEAGQALVVSITPVPHVQTYGRYEVRFRADVIPGYKIAWLLWPAGDRAGQGEIDFPEAWLRPDKVVWGYSHLINGHKTNQFTVDTGRSPQTWHTAVIEWRPDSLTFILDGAAQTTTDPGAIPQVPMYWSMQTETDRTITAAASGDIQIDYIRAWAYQPSSD